MSPTETEGFEPETPGTPQGYYRKKPIALEARQVCSALGRETAAWCGSHYDDVLHQIIVQTLEGPLAAHSGYWIIKGTRGEFWPVRGDVFAETYEPASSPEATEDQDHGDADDGRVTVSREDLPLIIRALEFTAYAAQPEGTAAYAGVLERLSELAGDAR
jgi:hypothetical protein